MAHRHQTAKAYRKAPVINWRFNGLLMGLINLLVTLERTLKSRKKPTDIKLHDIFIPAANGRHIKAVDIKPNSLEGPAPLLLYFHGGAFAMTYNSLHLDLCQHYAQQASCRVILVDYRLMPSNPWPAGFDDCYESLLWAYSKADSLGVDIKRIVVGGDSAGGALAAGIAQKALDNQIPVTGQMLIYPALDSCSNTISIREFTDTPLWNGISNKRMWKAYLKDLDPELPPAYAAPGLRKNLSGLPPTYVETAEFDPLRDEGINYAEDLKFAGVAAELNSTSGTIHGYDLAQGSDLVEQALKARVSYLRNCFSNGAEIC